MKIVVSMTTVPWRIELLRPVLESIRQHGGYDRFVINIPHRCARNGEQYHVPAWMNELVEINRCREDLGPATKLLPILSQETDPDTLIVTADDDVLYGADWLLDLRGWAETFPHRALGYVGATHEGFVHGEWINQMLNPLDMGSPVKVEVLGGYRGIAYRRKFFKDDVHTAMKDLLTGGPCLVDDHFFAAYLENQNVGRVVIPCLPNYEFLNLEGGIYDGGSQAGESNRRLKEAIKRWGWSVQESPVFNKIEQHETRGL